MNNILNLQSALTSVETDAAGISTFSTFDCHDLSSVSGYNCG